MSYGVSELSRPHWMYCGPRWLAPLTRFRWGRHLLRRHYRLWYVGEIQQEHNLYLSGCVDKLDLS